jgi:hypothetical protein
MSSKSVLAGARFHIPQFYGGVITAASYALAIGRKGYGIDVTAA